MRFASRARPAPLPLAALFRVDEAVLEALSLSVEVLLTLPEDVPLVLLMKLLLQQQLSVVSHVVAVAGTYTSAAAYRTEDTTPHTPSPQVCGPAFLAASFCLRLRATECDPCWPQARPQLHHARQHHHHFSTAVRGNEIVGEGPQLQVALSCCP